MGAVSRGFIGGVSQAVGQVADQRMARYSAEMLAAQRDASEQAKELRIEEMYNRRDKTNRENAVADEQVAYDKGQARISKERAAEIKQGVLDAPGLASIKAAEFEAGAPLREQQAAEARANALKLNEAGIKAEIDKWNNSEWVDAQERANPGAKRTREINLKVLELTLKEEEAKVNMPFAERETVEALQRQYTDTASLITKARLDGSVDADGLSVIIEEQALLSERIANLYKPYMKNVPGGDATGIEAAIQYLRDNDSPEERKEFDAGMEKADRPERALSVLGASQSGLITSPASTMDDIPVIQTSTFSEPQVAEIKAQVSREFNMGVKVGEDMRWLVNAAGQVVQIPGNVVQNAFREGWSLIDGPVGGVGNFLQGVFQGVQ